MNEIASSYLATIISSISKGTIDSLQVPAVVMKDPIEPVVDSIRASQVFKRMLEQRLRQLVLLEI